MDADLQGVAPQGRQQKTRAKTQPQKKAEGKVESDPEEEEEAEDQENADGRNWRRRPTLQNKNTRYHKHNFVKN